MLCFQAESSAVLFKVDVRKRFHLTYTGAVEAECCGAVLCGNGDVQYFCRVREDTAEAPAPV